VINNECSCYITNETYNDVGVHQDTVHLYDDHVVDDDETPGQSQGHRTRQNSRPQTLPALQ